VVYRRDHATPRPLSSGGVHPATPSDPPLSHQRVDAGTIAYTDEGTGPALLAIHGLPGSHRDYRWLAAALANRVRLVRIDQPGFGDTVIARPPTVWPEIAAIIAEFAAHVIAGPYVVLGHSFGAPLATHVAALDPAATGLALFAPVGLRPHSVLRRLPPLRWVDRAVRTPIVGHPVLRLYRRAMIAGGFPRSIRHHEVARSIAMIAGFRFSEHRAALARVRGSVFGAWTEDDPFVESAVVKEMLAAAPPGPRVGFAEGGHNLQKTHASELADALADWLCA
jgi:pimeloyl-ACP methyl ester carboxylesterase